MKSILVLALVAMAMIVAAKNYDLNKSAEDLFEEYLIDNPAVINQLANFQAPRIANVRSATLNIFKENVKKIKKLNALGEGKVKYDLGKFAHMSAKDFAAFVSLSGPLVHPNQLNATMLPEAEKRAVEAIPTSFSWKAKGKVTPVKNQGNCGSCWTFATAGNIESLYAIAGKGTLNLSEQQLVDCENYYSSGCNGGYPYYALQYAQAKGLVSESVYPYKTYQGSCKVSSTAAKKKIKSIVQVPISSTNYASAVATRAPLILFVNFDALQFYKSGVVTASKCGSRYPNHVVLLTGYGKDTATGKNFFEIKNSWGTGWGEAGYVRIERSSANVCGIYSVAPLTGVL